MVSIILVSYNKGDVTCDCVSSIHAHVTVPYEIIIVDNDSNDETQELLKRLENVRIIWNDRNAGFPAGCNIGLAAAEGDIIWFLNNDTMVPPNSLERMVDLLMSDDNIGIVGPVSNRIHGIQQIDADYEDKQGMLAFAERTHKAFRGQTQRVVRLVGFSMLIRKSSLDRLGGFDERMGIGTFEDDDLSLRFVEHGYRLVVARDAFIHHIGNVSFIAAGGYPSNGDHNQRVVSTTFGMTVPDETTINGDLMKQIKPEAKRVLHVECGVGAYGLRASEEGRYAVGLESSENKFRLAKNHYHQCLLYPLDRSFTLKGSGFDTAIMEKQLDNEQAQRVISSLRSSLASGAQVLIEVPKISAISGEKFAAYQDGWDENGPFPRRGIFIVPTFLRAMEGMGFRLNWQVLSDVPKGFFNRCAFARHQESASAIDGTLDFFKCWQAEFDYHR